MTTFPLSTLADLARLTATLPRADETAKQAATDRQDSLTKPPGALGRLEEIAIFMAAWQGVEKPVIETAQVLVFAGNHGVCAQGVNPFPQEVTAQMVMNFQSGGAAINQLCRASGAELTVIALDLDRPTGDITQTAAMSQEDTIAAMKQGWDAVDTSVQILCLGEMGIGNSTIAAALAAAAFGGDGAAWVGPGTGSDAQGIARKTKAIDAALMRHAQTHGSFQALAALGGREQAAICGAVLAARAARIPVVLDGYICTAAVAPLHSADPELLDHCLVAHASAEPGHAALVAGLGKAPLLDLGMRLGEGSGAALALGVIKAALACHNGMATFADAGVSGG